MIGALLRGPVNVFGVLAVDFRSVRGFLVSWCQAISTLSFARALISGFSEFLRPQVLYASNAWHKSPQGEAGEKSIHPGLIRGLLGGLVNVLLKGNRLKGNRFLNPAPIAPSSARGWRGVNTLRLEGLVFAADRQDRLNSADVLDTQRFPPGGTPGYTTATLRGLWTPAVDTTISAGVENAFDEAYRIHGSGQNEPGVNFVFGFERKF
jgi:outer membrane receptor protein involved in Fe transport